MVKLGAAVLFWSCPSAQSDPRESTGPSERACHEKTSSVSPSSRSYEPRTINTRGCGTVLLISSQMVGPCDCGKPKTCRPPQAHYALLRNNYHPANRGRRRNRRASIAVRLFYRIFRPVSVA